jgi:hypothetical protein
MKTGANPQGKGLVPVLDAWRAVQPASVQAKSPRRILADYFTTMLVLSAEFTFKPRPGVAYFLYRCTDRWMLSLVSPSEWRGRAPGTYLGCCELSTDMTWHLQVRDDLDAHPILVDALQAFHDGFTRLLDRSAPLEEGLPYYADTLPYYRRLLAAGLASSLSQSLALAGLTGTSSRHWLQNLATPSLAASCVSADN